ncbi:iron-containing alcohol dehydrogenase family protein [Thauera sp. Sel9]|uniref:iron-containing alcohol dehydrogenase family protein n=1 Tax=Thauera sp. Sel9 TaxID=2974299 RepID=UPI0021E112AF|nr:iron-containing alcohol dehydrogenase [Thauera sp. Sel9]MCV2216678.1 iron-containing alcohol dehydrogenase [Thauera sp. Sel9]
MNHEDVSTVVYQAIDLINARSVREFSVPPSTFIGPGSIARIGQAIAARGMSRVFIAIDESLEKLGLADGMYRSLQACGLEHVVYRQAPREPDTALVETMAEAMRETRFDGVIAFGGGSILDAAKAAVVLAANPGLGVHAMADEPARIAVRRAPLIAVPTTAGTGSEATNATVVTDTDGGEHVKHLIIHPDMIPDLAVIDACLTLGTPPHFTAAVGVDALTHAIEAYVAIHATPLTKALAYRAMTLIGEALPIAVGQGQNIEARESMMLASYMAGVSFSNAGLGLCHAMAHQIGPAYGIPHGIANAILLPSVMGFNQLVCKRDLAEIGHALSGRLLDAAQTIEHVQQLIVELGLPLNLREAGGRDGDYERFADAALLDPSLVTNPRSVSRAQVVEVYRHAHARQCATDWRTSQPAG